MIYVKRDMWIVKLEMVEYEFETLDEALAFIHRATGLSQLSEAKGRVSQLNSKMQITLRPLGKERWEVNIKMFDSNDVEFFHLDQYFFSRMDALKFINKINNSRQQMEIVL